METKDEHEERIIRLLILGFVKYYPLARESDPTDQDDLDIACRDATDETLTPKGQGIALAKVEAILRRLEDG